MSTNGENNVIVEVAAHEPESPRSITTRRALIGVDWGCFMGITAEQEHTKLNFICFTLIK